MPIRRLKTPGSHHGESERTIRSTRLASAPGSNFFVQDVAYAQARVTLEAPEPQQVPSTKGDIRLSRAECTFAERTSRTNHTSTKTADAETADAKTADAKTADAKRVRNGPIAASQEFWQVLTVLALTVD